MNLTGIPVSRWIDGVLEDPDNMDQPTRFGPWCFGATRQTRRPAMAEMKTAMEKLDMLVVVDPYPTVSAVLHDRTDGVYLLPACTQFETRGSVTASNRSIQWRDKVVDPLFESLPDQVIMAKFANKFGFATGSSATSRWKKTDEPPNVETSPASSTRACGPSAIPVSRPDRIKMHMANQHTFDRTTLQAVGGPADGDYYGLPWPCWGTAEMNHPGTPNLYDMSKPVSEGGLTFRARFGVERDGDNLLAEGVYSVGSISRTAIQNSPCRC